MTHEYKKIYQTRIKSNLKEKFKYKNEHQIPKLVKIQINRGLGLAAQNKTILQKTIEEVRLITGQQPIVTKAKKSIAGFKTREGMELGVTVTLRNDFMYAFLEKLINLVFPRIRDFRGLNPDSFDEHGNYNLGLREQLVFPEIDYNMIDQLRGYNISIVTTAETPEEGRILLQEFGFPFKKLY
uniref:ribosomal protein L5 n=1 Tax=Eustigmatophyceae sp. WTwin 8/9 T-6m6.8 TaxID=2974615 RepID=UPI00218217C4|nr:ribosomal protein L5 [Eustigmatophyceae sp. WTwin 8/9 T-6m6.8]UVI60940.1 ribosomal protein L5 [Eustigmatophyceae sp. WTwin 8/9 T-6m6.8]